MVGTRKRVAYICNAKDYTDSEARSAKVAQHQVQFEGLGFKFVEIDLREYFDKVVPANILDGFGLVWCAGGNTFLLNYALHRSGFADVLKPQLNQGKIVYGGSSAGAIVATPSLEGSEHGDDPGAVKQVYKAEIIWTALCLVPFYIAPHYKSSWFGSESADMVGYFKDNKLDYYALEDGQVAIVDGKTTQVLK